MKQTIFETRQRADELKQEAINIWRQSDMNDLLEGLEDDPVLSLLMTALAYQMNDLASDFELAKTEVIAEFAHLLTPYEIGHAVPATAIVETTLQEDVPEVELNSQSVFGLTGTNHTFIPLLNTRVLNAKVRSIVRLDGRRWKVSLSFQSPIKNIAGFAFVIKNINFQDLKVSLKGQNVPLIKPWHYSELPLNDCFGLDTILYNRSHTYHASATSMDLFARQNVRLFCINKYGSEKLITDEVENLDFIFEFSRITENFVFDKENLFINPVLLVNAQTHQVTLSPTSPIVRVAGYDASDVHNSNQFLHAVRPSEEQIYGNSIIEIRRATADRFNQGRLVKLLNSLLAKYHSDYYAYQDLQGLSGDKMMQSLQEILSRLLDVSQKDKLRKLPGVYMMLHDMTQLRKANSSVDVTYLTTEGANINDSLNANSTFSAPAGFIGTETRQIANPVMGCDEVREEAAEASLSRYYLATNDRIVTPADIKMFCYNELLSRYGVMRDMVRNISVNMRHKPEIHHCGYEIQVDITLADNPFVKRSFAEKMAQVEILLQKMMEVRSTNIYPIQVNIKIETV